MGVDFSELMQLAADIGDAPDNLPKHLRSAIESTSMKVKKDAQASVKGRRGLGHAASAIDYELSGFSGSTSGMSSEIGYDKGKKAGKLGNLIEFGAPNAKKHMVVNGKNFPVPPGDVRHPLAPSHDLGNALMGNEDDLVKGVTAAVDDAMKEAGL